MWIKEKQGKHIKNELYIYFSNVFKNTESSRGMAIIFVKDLLREQDVLYDEILCDEICNPLEIVDADKMVMCIIFDNLCLHIKIQLSKYIDFYNIEMYLHNLEKSNDEIVKNICNRSR